MDIDILDYYMKTLRDYYTELLETVLLEAQDYENMFKAFLDSVLNKDEGNIQRERLYATRVKEEIDWARKKLKKNDRIVWFLRLLRYELYVEAFRGTPLLVQSALNDFNRQAKTDYTVSDMMPIRQLKTNLEHFMSLNIPSIQNYVFDKEKPAAIFNTLSNLEREAQSKMGDDTGAEEMFRQNRLIEKEKDDKVIMRFPDGFAWVDLDTPADDAEGKAMGHCGNRASYRPDETILSLRKTVNYQGKQWWYPVCTFILDGDNLLGEMKGRNNDKPQDRYHPYIIALLKTKRIEGIKGGGHAPQNNFSLNDLTDEEREDLIEHNSNFAGADYMYRKEGMTNRVIKLVERGLENNSIDTYGISYIKEQKAWEVKRWSSFYNFIRVMYDEPVQELLKIAQGDADWQIAENDEPRVFINTILSLPYDWQEKLLKRVGIQGRNESDLVDAANLLIKKNDEWFIKFQELLNDQDRIKDQAWDHLKEYVDLGWGFACGGYLNIPSYKSTVEDLKKFVESDESVILYVSEQSMIDIATYSEDDYDGGEVNIYELQRNGWDHLDEYSEEHRREQGLTKQNKDTWVQDTDAQVDPQSEEFGEAYIQLLLGNSGTIRDPRQTEMPVEESLLERIKSLAGIV